MKKFRLFSALILVFSLLCFAACGGKGKSGTTADITAPELNIGIQTLNTVILDEVVLPKGTALDDIDGNLTENIFVEVVDKDGFPQVPKRKSTGSVIFVPPEKGKYTAVYSVSDAAGNEAKQTVSINAAEITAAQIGVKVDGVLDEIAYDEAVKYSIDGNVTISLLIADYGIYIGAEVLDNNLIYSSAHGNKTKHGFLKSDSIELCLDFHGDKTGHLKADDYKIMITADGLIRIMRGSTAELLYETVEFIHPKFVVVPHGTSSEIENPVDGLYSDTDTGYTVEMYLSYARLGVNPADSMGIFLAYRDVKHISTNNNPSQVNNIYTATATLASGISSGWATGSMYGDVLVDASMIPSMFATLDISNSKLS